jgi:type II secretory pathway component PulF
MPQFKFEGFDQSGGRVSSTLESESAESALKELRARGILASRIRAVDPSSDWKASLGLASDRVGLADLEFMTAELSLLLESRLRRNLSRASNSQKRLRLILRYSTSFTSTSFLSVRRVGDFLTFFVA